LSASGVSGTVTITGGSGLVGQLIRAALTEQGYEVRVFDRLRGPLVDLLRRRHLASRTSPLGRRAARSVRALQLRAEPALARAKLVRPGADDILGERDRLATRFAGSDAVIHLAGFPHPFVPGASEEDYVRVNYDASVNVFEAARAAGVHSFVFASSAQVYRINDPVRLEQLPILETNYLPLPAEGQTTYGFLKAAFERYLDGACTSGGTGAVSLRLEYPGTRSTHAANLYVSTSVENLVAGFACALKAAGELGFEAFNLADSQVDPAIVDVQAYVRERWPYVPNHTRGNECLMSTEKARRMLGYRPLAGGRYLPA
jgi:nucleoside-diphosphate-sugar epimerase